MKLELLPLSGALRKVGFGRMAVPASVQSQFLAASNAFRQGITYLRSAKRPGGIRVAPFYQGDMPNDESRPTYSARDTVFDIDCIRRYANRREWPNSMLAGLEQRVSHKNPMLEELHQSLRQLAARCLHEGLPETPLKDSSRLSYALRYDMHSFHSVLELKAYLVPHVSSGTPPVQRFAPHADLSLITLLLQDEGEGEGPRLCPGDVPSTTDGSSTRLQVLLPEDERREGGGGGGGGYEADGWLTLHPAETARGTDTGQAEAIVNAGEFGRIASGGAWRNAMHRVVEVAVPCSDQRTASAGGGSGSHSGVQPARDTQPDISDEVARARVTAALFFQPPWDMPLAQLFDQGRHVRDCRYYVGAGPAGLLLDADARLRFSDVLGGSAQPMEEDDLVGDWQPFSDVLGP